MGFVYRCSRARTKGTIETPQTYRPICEEIQEDAKSPANRENATNHADDQKRRQREVGQAQPSAAYSLPVSTAVSTDRRAVGMEKCHQRLDQSRRELGRGWRKTSCMKLNMQWTKRVLYARLSDSPGRCGYACSIDLWAGYC